LPGLLGFASYFDALKNVPTIGGVMVRFVKFVMTAGYIEGPQDVHMLGHSLGAHIIGSAGYQIEKKLGKKVGRVTGIDPAGPFMKLLKPQDRLSRSKGTFVDNVHTQSEFFGTAVPLGHIDFYANGGKSIGQAACLDKEDPITCKEKKNEI
jgi:hypothetical protein